MSLTKDQIQKAKDLPVESIKVPEWGGSVNVRTMTSEERDLYEAGLLGDKDLNVKDLKGGELNVVISLKQARARLVFLTCVDDEGNRLFTEPGDIELIGRKSAKAVDRLFAAAQRINGIGKKDLEELTGNSEAT